jgi:hypothetical protein
MHPPQILVIYIARTTHHRTSTCSDSPTHYLQASQSLSRLLTPIYPSTPRAHAHPYIPPPPPHTHTHTHANPTSSPRQSHKCTFPKESLLKSTIIYLLSDICKPDWERLQVYPSFLKMYVRETVFSKVEL